jgi:hypothetical protein
MRSLKVSDAYNSYGSMIHLHFGDLCEYKSGDRTYKRGLYYLMVETAAWDLSRFRLSLATNGSPRREIKRVLSRLLGEHVKSAHFSYPVSVIEFSNGYKLVLSPDTELFGPMDPFASWTLFHRDDAVLDLEHGSHRLR